MPYIKKDRRYIFTQDTTEVFASNAGELNYMVTRLVQAYLKHKGESYQTYNDIMGALEGAKLELYRRKIAPYEDTKIKENGDVW